MRRATASSTSCNAQHGFALVVVLWLVALLALMAVSQGALQRTETSAAANLLQAAQARAAAQAGIQWAILDLMRLPQARQLSTDGAAYAVPFSDATLYLSVVDEAGKVDLNFATGPLLNALLQAAGVEDERERGQLADAILDWRDSDELRRVQGAESGEYQAAGLSYTPRNAQFQSVEELALVLGMSAPLYHRLAPAITIFSGASAINATAAAGQLLTQLAQSEEEMPQAMDEQQGDATAAAASRRVAESGRIFTIRCEARLPGNVRDQLEAVVRLTPRRGTAAPLHETLLWREVAESRVAQPLPHSSE